MPKEAVHGERIPTFDAPLESRGAISAEEYEHEQPIVEVRWSRYPAGHVQVVTRLKGYELFASSDDDPDAPTPCQYGLFVTLDREGINDLIRKLRRARDQAFGRDE